MSAADRLAQTAQAFDAVARGYARETGANPVLEHMRARARAALVAHAPAGGSVLEIGCGPGDDAVWLARRGYRVTAVDCSAEMIRVAREAAGGAGEVRFHHLGAHELDRLEDDDFDACYSGLGALNCVPDLDGTARAIAARLRPGGVLVASVMGRLCPWELACFGLRGDWRRATVRLKRGPVAVSLGAGTVWTRYYLPGGLAAIFGAAGFRTRAVRALGLLAPPPYLRGFAARHPRLVRRLLALDDRVGAAPLLRAWGDHFLIVLRRDG